MRVVTILIGFMRQGAFMMTVYRVTFWTRLVNAIVKVFAFYALWSVLYEQSALMFPVGRTQIVTYGVMSVVLSEVLQWWDGPHFYVEAQIRRGTITSDLLRPIYFPFQVFARWLGQSAVILLTVALPVSVLAFCTMPVGGLDSIAQGVLFAISVALSYLILFSLNFLTGLIAFKTLSLAGINHTYHSLIILMSGMWIPLWFYPDWLKAIAMALPFEGIFFAPLSIYIGQAQGDELRRVLLHQGGWAVALIALVAMGWRLTYRRLTVQGG